MKAIAVAVCCVLALLPSVLGHATLIYPAPYGTPNSPSKTTPTGGGTSGVPVYPLNTKFIDWKLVAGDGAGFPRMLVNTAGTNTAGNWPADAAPSSTEGFQTGAYTAIYNVPLSAILASPDPGGNAIATYGTQDPSLGPQTPNTLPFGFTYTTNLASAFACTGTFTTASYTYNKVCTVQLSTASAWYSGFSFAQVAPTPVGTGSATGGAAAAVGTCVPPDSTQLQTCSAVVMGIRATSSTSSSIWIPDGETQQGMDAAVLAELAQNLPNQKVFMVNVVGGHTESPSVATPCSTSYTRFLCAQAFTPCNLANTQPATAPFNQPCLQTCTEFTCWCQLNPIHQYLYQIQNSAGAWVCPESEAGSDSTGVCPNAGPPPSYFGINGTQCINGVNNGASGGLGAAPHTSSMISPVLMAVVGVFTIVAAYFH
jgi:hypothetical protein